MRHRLLLACIGVAGFTAGAGAQRFRAGVDAVRVEVFVRDAVAPVSGLAAEDFELRDNGVPQDVELLKVNDLPVSAMLLLDTSNSVDGPALANLKDAARAAVAALRPDDHAAVMTFASAVTLRSGWTRPSAAIDDAIARAPQGGSTSLYDALFAALLLRDPEPGTRHLILLFSDGGDSASWLPREAVTEAARRADSVVYAVTIRPPGAEVVLQYRSGVMLWNTPQDPRTQRPFAEELPRLTGGGTYTVGRSDLLRRTFTNIIAEFRTGYVLGYTPHGVDAAGWHDIAVTLKQKKGTVRARSGYAR